MARRSRGREVAIQLLYQYDHNPKVSRADIETFARERLRDPELTAFCLNLFDGVRDHVAEIDQRLADAAQNWSLARMAPVDRNILRLGAYELLYSFATPPAVALDEAITLGRRLGGKDSAAFVNGVLDRLREDVAPRA